ncbi:hypothetical protein CSUI_009128 [Cystoisospora suis]|uniref:Uncharacterized protein n=1 Tax=Cystoisospora suis TaxID=483139 RepID=A0A2C6KKQ2_9APIC|nr:hypothetical protein CSUI_009128 [Cystoisospora suis]
MSPHNSEAPPFPDHTPDGSKQQRSRRPTGDSSVRGDQSSSVQPARFSSRDSLGNKPATELAGRRSLDNPKDEVDPAKIHATRTMWQQKLDEKLAKKEQEEYDAELKEVRRKQLENERETRKFLRRESQTGSGGVSHYSRSPGSLDDLQNRGRSFSNSSRDGGGVPLVSPSASPHPLPPPPSPPPPASSSMISPLDQITEEERARRQEEDDLLVAQRLQEEEALAASAAYPQPGDSSPSHHKEGLGALGGGEEGNGGGDNDELDPDFLLAMQLQEQAHREAQQEADSLLAARLQNEEAAMAGEGRVASSSSSSQQQEASHYPQGYYCGPGNQFYPYACPPSRPPPYSSTSVPAYRTTGGLQNVPQREGVQRIQTVASVSPPSPPSHSRPSAGVGGDVKKKKKKGLLSRLFGGKKDK